MANEIVLPIEEVLQRKVDTLNKESQGNNESDSEIQNELISVKHGKENLKHSESTHVKLLSDCALVPDMSDCLQNKISRYGCCTGYTTYGWQ